MKLTAGQKESFARYIDHLRTVVVSTFDFRAYMRQMDGLYLRQGSLEEAQRRAKLVEAGKNPGPIQEIIAPVVLPQVEAAKAYLTNLFLAQDPIFQAAAPAQMLDAATQFNAIIKRDADAEGWRVELGNTLSSTLKYNLACVELDYVTRTTFQAASSAPGGKAGATAKEVVRKSNTLKNISLYTAFWDMSVPPTKVHTEGAFAGYSEVITKIAAAKMYRDLPTDGLQCSSAEMFAAPDGNWKLEYPALKLSAVSTKHFIDLGPGIGSTTTNFATFFEKFGVEANRLSVPQGKNGKKEIPASAEYVKTTIYLRALPVDFGLTKDPGSDLPKIFKLVYINSVLVWANVMTNFHDTLPMIFATAISDGLDYQTMSFAENVGDLQTFISRLWTGELKSLDRAIGDRAIYNPLAIDPSHLKSTSGAAKIPLKPAYAALPPDQQKQIYYPIPYEDRAMGTRVQHGQMLYGFAERVNGMNPTMQGAFVKGNKTDNQFQETVQATEARLLMMGIVLETTLFGPLKEMIKSNILQYAVDEIIFDPATQTPLEISADTLRKGQIAFELGDGMAASAAKAALPVIGQAFQIMAQDPNARAEYDVMGMLSYFIKLSGFRRIGDFRYTPEQKAQNEKLLAAQGNAPQAVTPPPTTTTAGQ